MSPRPSVEEQRRKEVLDAAGELIAEMGHGRVRIADVAQRAGTSTGTVHYYFNTKEDVLDAAFRHAVSEARGRSEEALAGLEDPWERLSAIIEAHVPQGEARRQWLIWLQLWAEASVRPGLRALNDLYYGRWIDLVEGIVRDGQARGVFADVPSRDFVTGLLAMMDGLVIQHTMGSAEMDLDRIRELLLGHARTCLTPTRLTPAPT